MTKEQAIAELVRAAKLYQTTKLAEACRMAVEIMERRNTCGTCKHAAKTDRDEPCKHCVFLYGDKWEPKEE